MAPKQRAVQFLVFGSKPSSYSDTVACGLLYSVWGISKTFSV